jgi:hypothetical protein
MLGKGRLSKEIKTWQVIKKKVSAEGPEVFPHSTILSLARFVALSFPCPSVLELKCATAWR